VDHVASAATVAAVVAAYNEEARLGQVLEVLCTYPDFTEVIVVDDGSTDATAAVAAQYGARCLRLPTNQGKGAALQHGITHADAEVVFLADADIRALDHDTIHALVAPVAAGEVDMFVAMRHRSIYRLRTVLWFLPLLGGERAVSTKLWHGVPDRYKHRFKIEAALNFYSVHHGRGLRYRVFPIRQTPKECKHGLVRGLTARARMAGNVAAAIGEVHLRHAPHEARERRRAVLVATAGGAAMAAGAVLAASAGELAPRRRRPLGSAVGVIGGGLALAQIVRLAQSPARSDG